MNSLDVPRCGNKYMRLAAKIAMRSPSKYKMAAVLVRGGQIKAIAHNGKYENEHAELRLLNRCSDISGSTIYVVRVRPTGMGLARPCPMCWFEMMNLGVKKVVWSTNFNSTDEEKISNPPWKGLRAPIMSNTTILPNSYRLLFTDMVNETRLKK